MKKQSFRYLAGVVTAVVFFTSLHAQRQNHALASSSNETISTEFKSHSSRDESNAALLNERVLNDFNKNFKTAGTPSWSSIKNGFLVRSEKDGVQTRAFYDQRGRWSSTILTYSEDKLPFDVRRQVKSTYYDYTIYMVNEITVTDKTVYLVSIEDDKGYKTIRVADDETSVFNEFSKK